MNTVMKIYGIYAAVFCAAIASVSCKPEPQPVEENNLKIELTAKDWNENWVEFKDGEVIGVYAATGSSLSGERYANNEMFTKSGKYFEASGKMPVPDQATVFVAYKPYFNAPVPEGSEEMTISVKPNQSSITEYVNSDFMLGVASHSGEKNKTILPVEVHRLFSNIEVRISTGNNTGLDLTGADIFFTMMTDAEINFTTASISEVSSEREIVPKGSLKYSDGKFSGVSLITVPQVISSSKEFIRISLDGEESWISSDSMLEFKSGMKYTLDFEVEKVGINYNLEFTVTEEPWTTGISLDETLDLESNEINSVTDIDGNEYKVIKIGRQFWMGSNLITTKYIDGTDISFLASDTEWQNATYTKEGGYTYYQLNEMNIPKFGMYYNQFAASSDKLCPKGWRVPSQDDFLMMIQELGGASKAHDALKATSGWQDWDYQELPEYQGTNTSGMNVVPAGYRLDGGQFKNQNEFAYFWTRTDSNEYRSFATVLASKNKEVLTDSDFHRAIGMAVRCVRY